MTLAVTNTYVPLRAVTILRVVDSILNMKNSFVVQNKARVSRRVLSRLSRKKLSMQSNTKEQTMTSQTSCATPTPAEIDRFIAQAHQMRGDYIAQSVKSRLALLRALFSSKNVTKTAIT